MVRLPSIAAALLATAGVAQDESTTERQWPGGLPFHQWNRLSGDWGGLRERLADAGVEFGGFFTADLVAAFSGDVRRRSHLPYVFDLNVSFDLEALAGLPRTRFYVDAYAIQGRNPSADIGDLQTLSNVVAVPNTEQVAEVWLETWIDTFRIKVGKVDWNSEFAFREIGSEFVNSSAAIVPTVVAYPTYPNPAMSAQVFWVPSDRFYVGTSIYDGALGNGVQTGRRGPKGFFSDEESDAYLLAVETGTGWTGGGVWGSGRAHLGGFYHTGRLPTFDGGSERGTAGIWAGIEQRLWREDPTRGDDPQGLGVFVGYGLADDSLSQFGQSWIAGLEWIGPIPGRDTDSCGLGVFFADLSDDPAAGLPADETAIECYYKVQLTPAISLKPELQLVLDAGGQSGSDVLVGLLRFEVLF